jgi:hypothetical protein
MQQNEMLIFRSAFIQCDLFNIFITYSKGDEMKKILIIATLFSMTNINAEIGLKFDDSGHFFDPDKVYLRRAMRSEKKGFDQSATLNYKKAAEFGNNKAMYFLGVMYLRNKDWGNVYAWLRMVDEDIGNIKTLLPNIKSLIKDHELKISNQILVSLQKLYSDENAVDRRIKWSQGLKITGSRISQIDPVRTVSMKHKDFLSSGKSYDDAGVTVLVGENTKGLNNFVYNYKEIKTDITLGEIKQVDDDENTKENNK